MNAASHVLLDTSVVIDLANVSLGEHDGKELIVSSITMAELAYGMSTPDPVKQLGRSEQYHAAAQRFPVLAFGSATARYYGICTALVHRAGRNPRPRRLDLMIAAVAAQHRLPLLTRNPKDFSDLGELVDVHAL